MIMKSVSKNDPWKLSWSKIDKNSFWTDLYSEPYKLQNNFLFLKTDQNEVGLLTTEVDLDWLLVTEVRESEL